MMRTLLLASLAVALVAAISTPAFGQGNYEIQVYPSETVKPGCTMVELHSNFTVQGSKSTTDGSYPTEHQLHETVEITHGVNDWFEVGWYIFTSTGPNQGYQWVGDHIRPRVRIPEEWKWPVGLSLSLEFGYQRPIFSTDTWTLEIRPIIDKQIGHWYMAFNPTFDRSFHGPGTRDGMVFSPNVKVGYDFRKKIQGGFEYYGAVGPLGGFFPIREQQQQLVPSIDLNLSEDWEFNFGVGVGATHGTDHVLVKMILGYRFGRK